MLVAECLTALLFPFQWTLLYVPIVFTAALVCLDVPVPAIMGLRIKKSSENYNYISCHNQDLNDSSSDTSDDVTFEIQRCVVHIDTGKIQLPDDMPRFPDRTDFTKELNKIISRFNQQLDQNMSKESSKSSHGPRQSEDWTHLDDQEDRLQSNDHQPSQSFKRLAAIVKRTGITTNDQIEDSTKYEFLHSFNRSFHENKSLYFLLILI